MKSLAVMGVAALGLVGCGASSRSAPSTTTSTSPDTTPQTIIRIGFLGPLSGPDDALGSSVEDGEELAVSQYDVSNDEVRVIVDHFDSKGNPAVARTGATALVAAKVVAVIGPILSSEATAVGPIFEAAQIPTVSPTVTGVALAQSGSQFFHRVVADDNAQGAGAADFLAKTLGDSAEAVVDDSSSYGEGMAAAVRSRLAIDHGRDVFDGHLDAAGSDAATVTQILAAHPTAVFYGGGAAGAGRLLSQLRADGFSGHFMSDDRADNPQFVLAAGGAAVADGAYVSCSCADESVRVGAQVFSTAYRAEFGTAPPAYSAEAYDATSFVLAAVKSGATTPLAINTYLATHDYVGITKTIKFLPDGNLSEGTVYFSEVKDGRLVQVGSST